MKRLVDGQQEPKIKHASQQVEDEAPQHENLHYGYSPTSDNLKPSTPPTHSPDVFSDFGNQTVQQVLNQPTSKTLQRETIQQLQPVIGNRAVQRLIKVQAKDTNTLNPSLIQTYRPLDAFNFGVSDTGTLKEENFNLAKDKNTKPWVQDIVITFDRVETDVNGDDIPKGELVATYFGNAVAKGNITLAVSGGPKGMRSDRGSFLVHRIEGEGYNDPTAAADIAARLGESALEGPKRGKHRRYSKPDGAGERAASMHWAVFYNQGEAVHSGSLDTGSHGCVHVDSTDLKQLNYHSVIGVTKVKVVYTGAAQTKFYP
jgi:hypothetical protein